jgi:cell division protein FtsX
MISRKRFGLASRFMSFSEVIPYLLLFICTVSALFTLIFIKTAQQSLSSWIATQEISIFASSDLTEDEKARITQTVHIVSPSAQVTQMNQSQTQEMMIAELGLTAEASQASLGELIPNLFLVRGFFSDQDVEKLVEKTKVLAGVEDIQWGSSWVQKLKPVIGMFEKGAWVFFGGLFLFFHLLISYLILEMMKKDQNKYHIMSFLGATSFQIEKEVFKKLCLFLSVCLLSSILLVWVSIDYFRSNFASTLMLLSGIRVQMLTLMDLVLFMLFAFMIAFLSAKKSLAI